MKIKIEKKEDIKKDDILITLQNHKIKVIEVYGDVIFLSQPNDYEIVSNAYHFAEIIKGGYFKEMPDCMSREEALKALHNNKRVKEISSDKILFYDSNRVLRYSTGSLSSGLPFGYHYEIVD